MSRRAILLLATMAGALVVASGVALAAAVQCPNQQDGTCVGTTDGDEIQGTEGTDLIFALAGDDRVNAKAGDDFVDAGPGEDIVHGGDGTDFILGQESPDHLYGQKGNDVILGGPGNPNNGLFQQLQGEDDNDLLVGGDDTEDLFGQSGTNYLFGLGGRDFLKIDDPNSQDDLAVGGDGDDVVFAEDGTRDFISCGPGTDTVANFDEGVDVVASDCEDVPEPTASAATEAKMQDLEGRVERWAEQLQDNSKQR